MSLPLKRHQRLPLRAILIVPFVLQIFAAVGLTGYLSLRNGQKAVNDLASQLRRETSDRIDQHLDSYLQTSRLLTQTNAQAIQMGFIDPNDLDAWERRYWQQVKLYKVDYMLFGNRRGEYAGAGHMFGDDRIVISQISRPRTGNNAFGYFTDDQGKRSKPAYDPAPFEFEKEGWYAEVMKSGKPQWTSIYAWEFPPYTLSISYAHPVYDDAGKLIGSICTEQSLLRISDFLRQLKLDAAGIGRTFILERDGALVASSSSEKPYVLEKDKAKRLKAIDLKDPLIQATTQQLTQQFGQLQTIQSAQQLEFSMNGERQFVKVTPWKDPDGLDWLVVVAVPESAFMGEINANTRNTIWLCVGALAIATLLGLYTSRWVAQPILKLTQASQAIATGDRDQAVAVTGITEIETLATSFNSMAKQLKSSFEELEARVEERTVQLKEAKNLADSANQAKSEFLASMSHELRTPLNGILGYAQILQRTEELSSKGRQGIDIIYQCGFHLLTLINDVLDLSKIEARKLELHPAPLHFPSLLESVVEINRIRAEQKGIDFKFEADAALPIGISADEKRLRQVLINLLGNAIKFTDRGTVTFRIKAIDQKVRFEVQDTGVGMSPEQIEKIFLPFEQVGDTKKQSEGTGLGLAISQQIVALMDSTITVQSTLGGGSLFSFEVELPVIEEWAEVSRTSAQGTIVGYEGERQKILVIDDRWENRSVLVNLLEPIGFELLEASNGQEGIDQTLMAQPDLIITDLAMPIMDGFEYLSKVRSHPRLQDKLVIVSSASVFDIDRHKSIDAGGNDFLPKPVQTETLLDLIQKYLNLNWTYETLRETSVPESTRQIEQPPTEILNQLAQLAKVGELDELVEVAQQMQEQYPAFAQTLIHLVETCEIAKLREFIQQAIG